MLFFDPAIRRTPSSHLFNAIFESAKTVLTVTVKRLRHGTLRRRDVCSCPLALLPSPSHRRTGPFGQSRLSKCSRAAFALLWTGLEGSNIVASAVGYHTRCRRFKSQPTSRSSHVRPKAAIGAITSEVLERFAALLSRKLKEPGNLSVRTGYIHHLVDRVEISRRRICISASRRSCTRREKSRGAGAQS